MLHRKGASFQKICRWSRVPLRVSYPTRSYTLPCQTTVLENLICDSIKATGPISVSEYTQLCLSHPTEGYYMKERSDGADVFGARGDFITSPEISQVFGEVVGIWLLSQWLHSAARKPKIRLVELGPGRGTLMDDILRTFFHWPQVKAALSSVYLVESSPTMSSRQQDKLSHWFHQTSKRQLHTCTSIEGVPPGFGDEFTMIVAHEFFDALPVHIIKKTALGYQEVLVDLHSYAHSSGTTKDMASSPFRYVVSPLPTARAEVLGALSPRFAQLPLGTTLEVSNIGWRTVRTIGKLISHTVGMDDDKNGKGLSSSSNGAGLIIDYGDAHVFSSSFRAFKDHRLVDVFETPGMCDLTTNVDFALMREALTGIATTHGPLPQSKFLLQMGILERIAALVKHASTEDRRREIDSAGRRLIDQSGQGMGAVYRVLGITTQQAKIDQKTQVWPFVDEQHSPQ